MSFPDILWISSMSRVRQDYYIRYILAHNHDIPELEPETSSGKQEQLCLPLLVFQNSTNARQYDILSFWIRWFPFVGLGFNFMDTNPKIMLIMHPTRPKAGHQSKAIPIFCTLWIICTYVGKFYKSLLPKKEVTNRRLASKCTAHISSRKIFYNEPGY